MGGTLGTRPDTGHHRPRSGQRWRWPALGILGGAAALIAVTATTHATLSDTEAGSSARMTAATVVLGRGGGGSLALDYADLEPGKPQTGRLTVKYEGSIPADVSLRFRPGRDSACDGRSRPGDELLVTVGSRGSVEYCTLLGGQPLMLEQKAPPGWSETLDVTVELGEDAGRRYSDLSAQDGLTVRASNGFTDRIDGSIGIDTAEIPAKKAGTVAEEPTRRETERAQPPAARMQPGTTATPDPRADQSRETQSPTPSPSPEPAQQPTGEAVEQPPAKTLTSEPADEPAATASEDQDEVRAPKQAETPMSESSASPAKG